MNTPNKITTARMFIAPVFLAFYLSGLKHRMIVSALIFAAGAITDAIDGNLARKNNIVTNFGKLLDPIADKMLVTAGLLAFLKDGLCNIWIVMIILTREFAVTSVRLLASAQGVVIPANLGGKIKTVLQMVSFTAVMVLGEIKTCCAPGMRLELISEILMAFTAAAAVISGVIYFRDSTKVIDFKSMR